MRRMPPDVAAYMAAAPAEHRATLKRMRQLILEAAPDATERLSYGIPSFFQERGLVSIGAFRHHCSLFAGHGGARLARDSGMSGFKVVASTIQFPLDRALPARLIKRIVKARLAENRARARLARKPTARPKAKRSHR